MGDEPNKAINNGGDQNGQLINSNNDIHTQSINTTPSTRPVDSNPNSQYYPTTSQLLVTTPSQNNTPPNNLINQPIDQKKITQKTLILKIALSSLLIILSVMLFALFKGLDGISKYSLDNSNSGSNYDEDTVSHKSTRYTTTIQFDQFYENETIINNKDVVNVINKDSNIQREKCKNAEINSIESQIKTYGVDAVNLCEMDLDLAKEIAQSVKQVFDRYPNTKGYFTNLSLGNLSSDMSTTYAFTGPYIFAMDNNNSSVGTKIYIIMNSKIFLNLSKLDRSVENDVSQKFHPANFKRADVIIHELGHYLTLLLMLKQNNISDTKYLSESNKSVFFSAVRKWNDYDKNLVMKAYSNYITKSNSDISFDDFRATVSGYAMAKDDNGDYIYSETVAEAFSDVLINKDKATAASIEIVDILDKEMEKLK